MGKASQRRIAITLRVPHVSQHLRDVGTTDVESEAF
jgi:hypothetical protein